MADFGSAGTAHPYLETRPYTQCDIQMSFWASAKNLKKTKLATRPFVLLRVTFFVILSISKERKKKPPLCYWKFVIYIVYNPSVKNQGFLPPPFTQGRLKTCTNPSLTCARGGGPRQRWRGCRFKQVQKSQNTQNLQPDPSLRSGWQFKCHSEERSDEESLITNYALWIMNFLCWFS